MNPELTELKSSSAGTGLETPGWQCNPIWETGLTTADGFLSAAWVQIWGNTLLPRRNAWTREPSELRRQHLQHQASLSCSRATNPNTKIRQRREQAICLRRERREATALERGCNFVIPFSGGSFGPWEARYLYFVFVCLCFSVCPVLCLCLLSGDHLFAILYWTSLKQ